MRIPVLMVSAALLAACAPAATDKVATEMPARPDATAVAADGKPGCTAFVTGRPLERAAVSYNIEAGAFGEACVSSAVTLIIRDMNGQPVYTFASTADSLLGFEGVTDEASLAASLADWTGASAGDALQTTAGLPEWKDSDEYPVAGDFPFYVEEGMTRADYEALRREAKPMFCHVQGRESLACLELASPFAEKIGVQALPG